MCEAPERDCRAVLILWTYIVMLGYEVAPLFISILFYFLSLLLVLSFVYCGLKKRKEKNYFVVYDLLDGLKMYVIGLLKTLRQGGI
ncbi:hypothetical protein BDV30DRAFT_30864 [Aspergillus minisclerotigenes]|uniref:Uncharacterized protein n=1 Tax=Aspergillus minisclerotigenes TaxID=656917 RepID=A0A5N6IR91_9EURO|nr:hypothetical protein BDV30DRAFT_30864 [Aspergillus minisclerotigenes]